MIALRRKPIPARWAAWVEATGYSRSALHWIEQHYQMQFPAMSDAQVIEFVNAHRISSTLWQRRTRKVVPFARREMLTRRTGYSWTALVNLAKRHLHQSIGELTDEQLIELVRAHLEPVARPAPTSVLDTLGRVRRSR